MPQHKIYYSPDAFQKEITLLTCILRLRVLPTIPYPDIASLILDHSPGHVLRLACKTLPSISIDEGFLKNKAKSWLIVWLQEVFELEEGLKGEEGAYWREAREWSESDVRDVLKVAGLEGKGDKGVEFVVVNEDELEVQVKWRREGDWRAGSMQLGTVVGEVAAGQSPKSVSESLLEIRKVKQAWEEKRNRVVRASIYPCWKSFVDQIEEIEGVEEALKDEGCEPCE